jgi:hypothetical protein
MGLTMESFLRNRSIQRTVWRQALEIRAAAQRDVRAKKAHLSGSYYHPTRRSYEIAKMDLSNADDLCITAEAVCNDYDQALAQLLNAAKVEAEGHQVKQKLARALISAIFIPLFALLAVILLRSSPTEGSAHYVLAVPASSEMTPGQVPGIWNDRCVGRFTGGAILELLGGSGNTEDPWRLRTLPDPTNGCSPYDVVLDNEDVSLVWQGTVAEPEGA